MTKHLKIPLFNWILKTISIILNEFQHNRNTSDQKAEYLICYSVVNFTSFYFGNSMVSNLTLFIISKNYL